MKTEIILDIILILIGLYLAMFKSYFQEKGKNLATNEDIEGLTLKIESVKQQFLEKNANLKAKLDLLTNLKINHKNEERLALIEFHKKLKIWIGMLIESTPSLIDEYDINEIKAKIHLYDKAYSEFLASEALLELFVKDQKLLKLIATLKISTLENLAPHPSKFLIDIKHNNLGIENLDKKPTSTIEEVRERSEILKDLLDKRKAIYDKYREDMVAGYKKNINPDLDYSEYIREYLENLTTE